MIIPLSTRSLSMERSLEAVMKSLHEVVGLWMISSGGMLSNIEQGVQIRPESRSELSAPIRGHMSRYSKPSNPMEN